MPLTTALYDAIADLNKCGKCPTRETIVKYLKNCYCDVRIPNKEVIHECLGILIKERRIYHNGEGYFAISGDDSLLGNNPEKVKVIEKLHKAEKPTTCEHREKKKHEHHQSKKSHSVKLANESSRLLHDNTPRKALSDEERYRLKTNTESVWSSHSTPAMFKKNLKELEYYKKRKTCLFACGGNIAFDENGDTLPKPTNRPKSITDSVSKREGHQNTVVEENQKNTFVSKKDKNAKGSEVVIEKKERKKKKKTVGLNKEGEPYGSHPRDAKSVSKRRAKRSRSYTEPSKSKQFDKTPSQTAAETHKDFPLRRVMGRKELRALAAAKETKETSNVHQNGNVPKVQEIDTDETRSRYQVEATNQPDTSSPNPKCRIDIGQGNCDDNANVLNIELEPEISQLSSSDVTHEETQDESDCICDEKCGDNNETVEETSKVDVKTAKKVNLRNWKPEERQSRKNTSQEMSIDYLGSSGGENASLSCDSTEETVSSEPYSFFCITGKDINANYNGELSIYEDKREIDKDADGLHTMDSQSECDSLLDLATAELLLSDHDHPTNSSFLDPSTTELLLWDHNQPVTNNASDQSLREHLVLDQDQPDNNCLLDPLTKETLTPDEEPIETSSDTNLKSSKSNQDRKERLSNLFNEKRASLKVVGVV